MQEQLMDMRTIVEDWKANAERNLDRNFTFVHRLKMKSDSAVDRVAHRLHEEAFSIIDCTQCANCCKVSSPLFRKSDVRRIAEHLAVKPADFMTMYSGDNETSTGRRCSILDNIGNTEKQSCQREHVSHRRSASSRLAIRCATNDWHGRSPLTPT
jgi:hypothetical protein